MFASGIASGSTLMPRDVFDASASCFVDASMRSLLVSGLTAGVSCCRRFLDRDRLESVPWRVRDFDLPDLLLPRDGGFGAYLLFSTACPAPAAATSPFPALVGLPCLDRLRRLLRLLLLLSADFPLPLLRPLLLLPVVWRASSSTTTAAWPPPPPPPPPPLPPLSIGGIRICAFPAIRGGSSNGVFDAAAFLEGDRPLPLPPLCGGRPAFRARFDLEVVVDATEGRV